MCSSSLNPVYNLSTYGEEKEQKMSTVKMLLKEIFKNKKQRWNDS